MALADILRRFLKAIVTTFLPLALAQRARRAAAIRADRRRKFFSHCDASLIQAPIGLY